MTYRVIEFIEQTKMVDGKEKIVGDNKFYIQIDSYDYEDLTDIEPHCGWCTLGNFQDGMFYKGAKSFDTAEQAQETLKEIKRDSYKEPLSFVPNRAHSAMVAV